MRLLIILGGVYLVARNMMNWRIPVSILTTVFVLSGLLYLIDNQFVSIANVYAFFWWFNVRSCFYGKRYGSFPITPLGIWIYGGLIGLLVVVIRIWGGLPEGVMYAILLGNAVSPHIDNAIRPRVYGTSKVLNKS